MSLVNGLTQPKSDIRILYVCFTPEEVGGNEGSGAGTSLREVLFYLQSRKRDTDVENKHVHTKGREGAG